ncbi:MAG: VWA domain-containing protein [candidate division Zixibacteria bacterium]|nr:VWA domain-containing protein [candidate division Zixibacteria bacterium]
MKKTAFFVKMVAVIVLTTTIIGQSFDNPAISANKQTVLQNMSLSPLCFTENQGQWDERAFFRANAGGATMWFTREGVYYQFVRKIDKDISNPDHPFQTPYEPFELKPDSFEQLVIKASFVGANPDPVMSGEELMEYKCNYFIGNDPNNWHTDVSNYKAVQFRDIYPGIDLKYYGNGKQMEYDFIVSPGTDYTQIQIKYEGARSLSVNSSGELVVETDWGDVIERKPIIYQMDSGKRQRIEGEYKITDNSTFSFKLDDSYNPNLPLIIDPVLVYSTYLGGGYGDGVNDIVVDDSEYAYVVGSTYGSEFPVLNPYQTYQGNIDVVVTKLSQSGNNLIYSTYLGGGYHELGYGIAVDDSGQIYVTGTTNSTSFPTLNQFQTKPGPIEDYDAFISKLSSSGNELKYSTYLGGNAHDNARSIAVDASGSAFVTGATNSTDFPVLSYYQTDQAGSDAFVTKFSSSGSSLIYSTYLGGSQGEGAMDIAVDDDGSAYITGGTISTDFPTHNSFQEYIGDADAFVSKLSSSGNSLAYSTHLGGDSTESGFSIAVDNEGSAYVTGETLSSNFPTANPYQIYQGKDDVFVTKLSYSGSAIVYSTFLGGNEIDNAMAIAVDDHGRAYITGLTKSIDFPILNSIQPFQGIWDAFITKFSSSGNSLNYSTYLGGSAEDEALGIAIDDSGHAYVAGFTYSMDFPTVNPYQTDQEGSDAFVVKLPQSFPSKRAIISVDRSGSMSLTNPLGQSRLERAKSMAHDEIDSLLDFNDLEYPGTYQAAVMSFNADGIVLLQDFTSDETDLHDAVDAIQNPRHDTPLAAAMCQSHCLIDDLDAEAKYVFTFTDGLENESQNFDICSICEPCNDLMATGWNYDCDPSNQASCTDWQICLHDQFSQTGINIVHYFGEPINPFEKGLDSGLEDMYFLKNTAEASDGEFLYHSDHETICGDANNDGALNVSDAVYLIVYIFQGGTPPESMPSADCNCDGNVNISDAVNIINHVFLDGFAPCDINGDGELDC